MQPRNLTLSATHSGLSRSPRLVALQDALSALNAYMLDECPEDQNWEDFDPDIDELRTGINELIGTG